MAARRVTASSAVRSAVAAVRRECVRLPCSASVATSLRHYGSGTPAVLSIAMCRARHGGVPWTVSSGRASVLSASSASSASSSSSSSAHRSAVHTGARPMFAARDPDSHEEVAARINATRNDIATADDSDEAIQRGRVEFAMKMEELDMFGASGTKSMLTGYGDTGFSVNNVDIKGGIVVLPDDYFFWRPMTMAEVTVDDFAMFTLLTPRVKVLLLGTGECMLPVSEEIRDAVRRMGIVLEPMDSKNACATFNFLNQEDRNVAVCLLPVALSDRGDFA